MSIDGDSRITTRSALAAAVWLLAAAGAFALFVLCISGLPDMSKGNHAVVPYEMMRMGGGLAALSATFLLVAQAARTALVPKTHDQL